MPIKELKTFEKNLQYATDIAATGAAMSKIVASAMDFSDLYRAAFMQGVSAFDYYIHDEVRARMVSLSTQSRSTWPVGYASFKVPLSAVHTATIGTSLSSSGWLEAEIREQHQHLSFQNPDKVAGACRLVSDVDLWSEVANHLGIVRQGRTPPNKIIKRDLRLIVDRRNLIVHEADLDPTPPRTHRYPIDLQTTQEALQFLDDIGHAISVVL